MWCKERLTDDLAGLGVHSGDTLLVHSSIKAVGPVDGGADALLDALQAAVGPEGLLVLPTHSWAYINELNPVFSVKDSPSCVGMLPEIFRHRAGVVRSLHPTHSVAAWGRDAAAFCQGHERFETPCAWDSRWGRIAQRGGTILMLGVSLSRNTFVHGVEEWNRIPGRLTEGREPLVTVDEAGNRIPVPSRRHIGDVSVNYDKLDRPLLWTQTAVTGKVGDAFCWLIDAEALRKLVAGLLAHNPDLFMDHEPVPEAWYR